MLKRFVVLAVGLLVTVAHSLAAPNVLSYQGRLTDPSGKQPVTDPVPVAFSFFNDISTGSPLEGYTYSTTVDPNDLGFFSVLIGDAGGTGGEIPAAIFGNDTVFLNVNVNGENLVPRVRLGSAPYAFQSEEADHADAADQATAAYNLSAPDGAPSNVVSVDNSGNVVFTSTTQDQTVDFVNTAKQLEASFWGVVASRNGENVPPTYVGGEIFNIVRTDQAANADNNLYHITRTNNDQQIDSSFGFLNLNKRIDTPRIDVITINTCGAPNTSGAFCKSLGSTEAGPDAHNGDMMIGDNWNSQIKADTLLALQELLLDQQARIEELERKLASR